MNRFSIAQLEAFYWLGELGSVQKAADRLNIAQPTLSLRLKQLEVEAAQALLERHGRGVRLTRQGHAFLSRVKIVIDAYNELGNLSLVPDLAGPLRIGVAEGFAVACMATLISQIQQSFPLLRPEWVVATSAGLEQSLSADDLDLAILVDPIGLKNVRLFALGLQGNDWAAAASLAPTIGTSPQDLARFPIITTPPGTAMYRATFGWMAEGKITPENVCVCSSLNAALQLVAARLGIGVFPSKVIESYPLADALVKLPIETKLDDGRVFVADNAASDEMRTRALVAVVEQTSDILGYFR